MSHRRRWMLSWFVAARACLLVGESCVADFAPCACQVLGQEWEEEEGVSSSSSSTSSAPREEAVEQAPQPRKPRVLFAWPRLQAVRSSLSADSLAGSC